MAGIYAFLALIGGVIAFISTDHQSILPTLVAVLLLSNLLPLLAALLIPPAAKPIRVRTRR